MVRIAMAVLAAAMFGFAIPASAQTAPTAAKDAPAAAAKSEAKAPPKAKDRCQDGEPSEVATYKISKGETLEKAINEPLDGKTGDADKGLGWMAHRRLGNCLACHKISKVLAMAEKTPSIKVTALNGKTSSMPLGIHGEIGPPLDGVANRYTEGELRMLVVDPKTAFPDTIMPAFHKNSGFTSVHPDCQGLAIFNAQQVEDVVAFLKTLK